MDQSRAPPPDQPVRQGIAGRYPLAGEAGSAAGRRRDVVLSKGDYAPWFKAAALSGLPDYSFNSIGGRHVLMLFYGSAGFEPAAEALRVVARNRRLFDDDKACFFGVTVDPRDAGEGHIAQQLPGIRFFLDYDRHVSELFGACSGGNYLPRWFLLDPTLRVTEVLPIERSEEAVRLLRAAMATRPADAWAPVLPVPSVLDPALCRTLIEAYEGNGGHDSGFMRDVDGKTKEVTDPYHKQRRDYLIEDEALQRSIRTQMNRRLSPALLRAFQFKATRMERYLVACYEAGAGHFRPHRDNTTKGTAHRQFAVTINLNAGDYDGGDLRFPEYGERTYRAPTGGAIVFSCSLLHEATPVTRGRRFAFLPFLYNEEGAQIREANNPFLGEGLTAYSRDGTATAEGDPGQ